MLYQSSYMMENKDYVPFNNFVDFSFKAILLILA